MFFFPVTINELAIWTGATSTTRLRFELSAARLLL